MFSGAFTALVTPMRGGQIDLKGLADLVEFQLAQGIDGLVPCGTTGETPTLTEQEQSQVIKTVVELARGKVPVIAGAGCNATAKAIALSKMAAEAGADALLHVTPYYNKPPQAALVAHYRAITEAVGLPIVMYNVPGRTGCDLEPETAAELAEHPSIVALKEATGSIARAQHVVAACRARDVDLALLSGDDATAFAQVAVGGAGVISVVSNIVPDKMSTMIRLARAGQIAEARQINYEMLKLMDLMFLESNPIPVKAGVSLLGHTANELRAPLQPLGGDKLEQLRSEMQQLGLLR